MSNIPAVPGAESAQTPSNRPKLDMGAMTAPARGRMAIAGAVGQLGDVAGQFAFKMQEARNSAAISHADLVMSKAKDDFQQYMAQNPDDWKNWGAKWEDTANSARDKVFTDMDGRTVSPVVRRRLEQAFPAWNQMVGSEVGMASTKAEIGDIRSTVNLAATLAAQQGNEPKAIETWNSPAAKRAFPEAERNANLEQVGQVADLAAAVNGINANPAATLSDLEDKTDKGNYRNFKRLTEEQRYSLVGEARERVNQQQGENLQGFIDRVATNPMSPPGDAELQQAVKAKAITARGANSIRALVKKSNIEESPDWALILDMQVHDHDFTTDPEPEKSAREFRDEAAALPIALQKPIQDFLSTRMKEARAKQAADPTGTGPSVIAEMDREDRSNGAFLPSFTTPATTGGFLWSSYVKPGTVQKPPKLSVVSSKDMTDAQVQEWYGEGMTVKKLLYSEQLHYAKYKDRMRAIEKAHPDWTVEQLLRARHELLQTDSTIRAGSGNSSGQPIPPVEGKIYVDGNGNRAMWKDGLWQEVK
jgi:hypothetical protein